MKILLLLVAIGAISGRSLAMPGAAHDRLAGNLRGTPVKLGGVGDTPMSKLKSINRWMDHPATTPGRYRLRSTGKLLSPSNHNMIRHNPVKVARVFSGTGGVSRTALNVAWTHVAADVAVNTRPVNGVEITPARRAEARKVIDFVKQHRRLPPRLPIWIDGLPKTPQSVTPPVRYILPPGGPWHGPPRPFPPRPYLGGGLLGSATAIGGTAAGLTVLVDGGLAVAAYGTNQIGSGDLKQELVDSAIRGTAVGLGTGAVVMLCSTPHGLVLVVVGVGSYLAADAGIALWQDHWGNTPIDLTEWGGIVPQAVATRPMLAESFLNQ